MENRYNDIPTPFIDMSPICHPEGNEDEFLRIGKEIVKHFQDPGFVYLKNIGISTKEIKYFVNVADKFFELGYETKLKSCRNYETLHGYSNDDAEVLNPDTPLNARTTKSIFDIQGMDEPFPEEVPEFRTAAMPLIEKLVPITKTVLKALEMGLDFPTRFLVDKHKHVFKRENFSDLRITSYEPPSTEEQTIRCEAHCDFSTITLQMYADLEGLQLLDKKGNWQSAKLYEGYSILFPSEQLQLLTGDKIKAAMHQVLNPVDHKEVGKPRHAVVFFITPDHDVDLRPYNDVPEESPKIILSKDFTRQKSKTFFKEDVLTT